MYLNFLLFIYIWLKNALTILIKHIEHNFSYLWLYTKYTHINSCLHTCILENDAHYIPPSFLTPCPLLSPPIPLPYLEFIYSSHAPHSLPHYESVTLYQRKHSAFVFGDWLTSLSIIFPNSINLPANAMILFSFIAEIFPCIYVPQVLYPFI